MNKHANGHKFCPSTLYIRTLTPVISQSNLLVIQWRGHTAPLLNYLEVDLTKYQDCVL